MLFIPHDSYSPDSALLRPKWFECEWLEPKWGDDIPHPSSSSSESGLNAQLTPFAKLYMPGNLTIHIDNTDHYTQTGSEDNHVSTGSYW